jgi:hypothetical protein
VRENQGRANSEFQRQNHGRIEDLWKSATLVTPAEARAARGAIHMRKIAVFSLASAIGLALATSSPAAVNSLSTAAGGVGGQTKVGVAVNAVSSGRACGKIGGVIVAQAPSCTLNGAIPPTRTIAFVDGAGNTVNATSRKLAAGGFKANYTHADQTSVTKPAFAQAEFTDPLTFTDPSGGAFDVTLSRFFAAASGTHGLELGAGGSPGSAFASFDSTMSSNLTGMLYSLDISDVAGQPLGITVTLGSYVMGLPGWNKVALETQLRTALGANMISSDYFTDSFAFPDILIHVPASDS